MIPTHGPRFPLTGHAAGGYGVRWEASCEAAARSGDRIGSASTVDRLTVTRERSLK